MRLHTIGLVALLASVLLVVSRPAAAQQLVAWLEEQPRTTTRTSRFAALAPVHDLPAETPAV
jgi:hypothetical protein